MSPETEHVLIRLLQLAGIGVLVLLIWGGLYLIRDRMPPVMQPKQPADAIAQVCAQGFKVIDASGVNHCP